MTPLLSQLLDGLRQGAVEIVDLSQPLSESTPVLQLPPPLANTPGWKMHRISHFDERGPAWSWNWFEGGEHVGTHFDAPAHWITGRDSQYVADVPPERLIGPAVMIDKSHEAAANADYLLTLEDLRSFERAHGPFPQGGWLLFRTGWDARAQDAGAFLNASETGPHTPGVAVEAARWIAEQSPLVGLGVETVGTDAGMAHSFAPAFPCHHYLSGAGKYGLTQLANLAKLPPTGSVIIVAPLKLVAGTGSPTRVFVLVPRG